MSEGDEPALKAQKTTVEQTDVVIVVSDDEDASAASPAPAAADDADAEDSDDNWGKWTTGGLKKVQLGDVVEHATVMRMSDKFSYKHERKYDREQCRQADQAWSEWSVPPLGFALAELFEPA